MFDPNQCSSLSFSQVLSNFPNFTQNPKLETEKVVPKSLQVIDADLPQTFKSGDLSLIHTKCDREILDLFESLEKSDS
jgi:hypothetical protein